MKMLSKENLMAKTSDIGSCLGLLAGKLLSVGFVIGAFSANAMHSEFEKANLTSARLKGSAYKVDLEREREATELLRQKLVRQEQEAKLLQEQLAGKTAPGTASIDIPSIKTALLARIDSAFEGGRFNSPVKAINVRKKRDGTPGHTNLRSKISSIAIHVDPNGVDSLTIVEATRSAVITQCLSIFREYMEQPGTDKENLSVVVRSGGSPVRTIAISTESILRTFELTLRGTLDPNLAQLLRDCQLQAALPTVYEPKALTINFDEIAEKYIRKLNSALSPERELWQIIQPYQPEIHGNSVLCSMVEYYLNETAGEFTISGKMEDIYDAKDELVALLFKKTCFTIFSYMSGNNNRKSSAYFGRGQEVNTEDARKLHKELSKIFDPRSLPSFRVTHTQIEFSTERAESLSVEAPRIAMFGWKFPLLNGFIENAFCPIGPARPLLEDGSTGSISHISSAAAQQITDRSDVL